MMRALIFGLVASIPLPAMAEAANERVARNGAVVPMPPIESLDCAAMANVIQRIDAANYRDPNADDIPEGHPDRPIFDYENALTAEEYFKCTLGRSQDTDPGLAFEKK